MKVLFNSRHIIMKKILFLKILKSEWLSQNFISNPLKAIKKKPILFKFKNSSNSESIKVSTPHQNFTKLPPSSIELSSNICVIWNPVKRNFTLHASTKSPCSLLKIREIIFPNIKCIFHILKFFPPQALNSWKL